MQLAERIGEIMRGARAFALSVAALAALGAPASAEIAISEFCRNPTAQCSAVIDGACLERFGAGSLSSASADCRAQVVAYRDCVSRIAEECPVGAPQATTSTRTGSSDEDRRIYCQSQTSSCLDSANDDYRECRGNADGDCRADCREERDIARDECNDALRSCLTTGQYRAASFEFPGCALPGVQRSSTTERVTPTPAPTMSFGTVCRNGPLYCFMFQPAMIGSPCGCSGAPAMGVPPFQGLVSPQ